jgi:hypothetical protein
LRKDLGERSAGADLLVLEEEPPMVIASFRLLAAALLVAAAAATATAQPAPVTMTTPAKLIDVSSCVPTRPTRGSGFNDFSPAFYPLSPYYWNDPYGFQFSQPALLPTSGSLAIDYTNVTTNVMKTIDFGLVARGKLVAEVRDVGTFSPNAEIKHEFGLDRNVFPLRTALSTCIPLRIVYADGTIWKNTHLPKTRKELYRR